MAEEKRLVETIKQKHFLNKLFISLMLLLELIILGAIAHIVVQFIKDPGDDLYNLTALGLLLLWFGILTAYYAWAVYFYNINLGLTNEDWAEIRLKKRHTPESAVDAPTENPNINETLGLPTGTVRGSLALTLMVSAMAMTIASLGMPTEIKENSFIVDNFDFIKTAFLMMIAFYFGNKSLEMLGYKSKRIIGSGDANGGEDGNRQNRSMMSPAPTPPSNEISKLKKVLKGNSLESDEDSGSETEDNFDNPDSLG